MFFGWFSRSPSLTSTLMWCICSIRTFRPNFAQVYLTLHTLHSTLHTRHARHHILHLTLYTPHSMLGDRLYVTPHSTLHVFQTLLPSIFPPVFNDLPSFFFLPFSCHSSIFLHFPPAFNDFPPFFVVFFLPFSCHSSIFLHFPLFSTIFLRFFPTFFLIFPLFSTIFLHFP